MRTAIYTLLALFALSLAACGRIELPDSSEKKPTTKTDTEDSISDKTSGGYLTVAQALKVDSDTAVKVVGYYVGYGDGSKFVPGIPTDGPNACMMLADSPDETENAKTFAVYLGSTISYERELWNLYDNPDYYQKRLVVKGIITTYYRKNGIKKDLIDIYLYNETEEPANPDNGDDKENNGGDNGNKNDDKNNNENGGKTEPTDTTNTTTPTTDTPTVKDSTEVIKGGR